MPHDIRIAAGGVEIGAVLNDTATASGILSILPIRALMNLWGEEIYFQIPLEREEEDARETVSVGDIAYWPQGNALCVFLGTTPISRGDEVRPISPVNVVGRTEEASRLLAVVRQGDEIEVRR